MTRPVLPLGRLALHPLAIAAAFLLHGLAAAAPEGARPVFGQTQVSRPDATTTRIDQTTARAGIDWQGFSIGTAETVLVVQPDARSVLVNRVTGLEPSLILGKLQANGRVFLTNPRGVIFGQGAQVDVGGLVATTLSLGDADAQAGRWWLQDGGQAGAVRNAGDLRASDGTVALLAPQVENSGSIDARRVALGAVSAARVDLDGDGLILFDTRAADAARLDQLGRIAADGGRAELIAQTRGQVASTVLNLRGAVFARGLDVRSGEIVIDGGASGVVEIGGRVDASSAGGSGGRITALGDRVLLDGGAQLDASGARGGGRIDVGGGLQGRDPALRNAAVVVVQGGAVLDASATLAGDGGRVVVWSDQATHFAGRADARGGAAGGDGGLVEVSGKQALDFAGSSDRSAARGRAGTLLLDPTNLTIQAATPDIADNGGGGDLAGASLLFAAPGTHSRITSAALQTQLAAGSVTLQAADTLTVAHAVAAGGTNSLTLQAGNNIAVNAPVSVGGNLVLSAGDASAPAPQSGAVSVNQPLTVGGTLTLNNGGRGGVHQLAADLSAASLVLAGDAALTAPVALNLSGTSTLTSALTGTATLTKAGAGTLALGSGGALPSGTLVVSGGTLDLGGGSSAVAGLTQTGGSIVNGTLTATTSAFDLQAGSASVALGGPVGATKSGSGSYTLAGANLYTGDTQVLAGTLIAANNAALGTTGSPTTVASGATLQLADAVNTGNELLTLTGNGVLGVGALTASGGNSVGNLVLDGDASIGGAGGLTVLGSISDTATARLTKLGSGTLTLSGLAQHHGGTRIEAGTLVLGAPERLPDTDTVTVAGGTLALGASNEVVGGLLLQAGSITGTGTLTSGTSFDLQAGSVSAALGGAVGIIKSTGGTVTLSGNNSYTGSTSIDGGTLALGAADVLPNGSTVVLSSSTATLNVGGFSDIIAGLTLIDGAVNGSGELSSSGSYALQQGVVRAALNGSASLTKSGSGTVFLYGANGYSGSTTVSQGTLSVANSGKLGSAAAGTSVAATGTLWLENADIEAENLTMAGGVLRASGTSSATGAISLGSNTDVSVDSGELTLGGVISGASRSLTKKGTGTLLLQASNTYTGATTVQFGTLALDAPERLSDSSALVVAADGTLTLNGNERVASLSLTGSLDGSGSLTTANQLYALNAGATVDVNAQLGTGTLNVEGNATLNGTASTGTVNLNAGTLTLGAAGRLLSTVAVNTAANTTLALKGDQTVADISGAGEVATGSGFAFTIEVPSGTVTFAGGVTGDGSLEKSGQGELVLSGASSYSGATTVNAGILRLGGNDRLPTTTELTVDGSATLRLNGNSQRVGSFTGGFVEGPGTLRADRFNLKSGGIGGSIDLGTVPITVTGVYTLGSSTGASDVTVESGGELTLLNSGLFSSDANLVINGRLLMAGDESVNSLQLSGELDGAGRKLTAWSYELNQGASVLANLGTGTLVVLGNASLSGTAAAEQVRLQNGATLTTGSSNRLNAAPALTLQDGSSLALGNRSEAVANLSLDNGSIPSGTLSVSNAATLRQGSIGAKLSGNANVTKTGAGTVLLTGDNDYSGGTVLEQGTLALQPGGQLGNSISGTVVKSGGKLELRAMSSDAGEAITLDGGSLLATGGASSVPGSLTLSSGASLDVRLSTDSLALATSPQGASTVALTKLGAGVLTLNAAAGGGSYGGATLVNGGTLALGTNGALPSGTTVQVDNGATLALASFSNTVAGLTLLDGSVSAGNGQLSSAGVYELHSGSVDAVLAGTASLTKAGSDGSSVVTLSKANLYDGLTTVGSGTLRLTGSGALGSATGGTTVQNGTTLRLDGVSIVGEALTLAGSGVNGQGAVRASGGTSTVGGPVTLSQMTTFGADAAGDTLVLSTSPQGSAAVGLVKVGDGTLRMDAAATAGSYGGATTVSKGTLHLGTANALPDGSAVVVNGGATLNPDGNSDTVASLRLDDGSIGAGTLAASGGFELRQGSVQAVLAGNGGLVKSTAGSVQLSAAATYTGATSLTDGTLQLTVPNALPGTTALTLGNGATLDLGIYSTAVSSVLLDRGSITGTGTLSGLADHVLREGSVSAGLGGAVGLQKTGNTTVLLSGANSYSGATTVSDGTLQSAASDVLPNASTVTVSASGRLDLAGFSDTVAGLVLDGGSVLGTGAGLLSTSSYQLRSGSVSASLGGTVGIDKTTTGTVNLSSANTFSGTTTVSAGTLNAQHAQALGSAAGGTAVNDGATLVLASIDIGNEALAVAGKGMGDMGALQASGTARAGGNVTLVADATVGVGTSAQLTLAGAVGGSGGLVKRGGGSLQMAGSGSYGGATMVSEGTLALAAGAERLPDATALQVASGATMQMNGDERVGSLTLAGTLSGSGTLTASSYTLQAGANAAASLGAGVLNVAGAATLGGTSQAGEVNVQAQTLTLAAADRLSDAAIVNVSKDAVLALNGSDTVGALNLFGTLSGSGTLTAAATTISGGTASANTAGNTLVSSGSSRLDGLAAFPVVTVADGSLALGSAGRLTINPAVTVAAGAALDLAGAETFGSLAGAGNVGLGAATLTTGSGGDSAFSGVLAGSGGLVKQGGSTFTLSGNNAYTGGTRVAGGTLAIAGTQASLRIDVAAGTLALAAADRLADAAAVNVASGATMTLNGSDQVGSLALAGRLGGSGTLTAATYALNGGTASADLGLGELTSSGSSRLDGTSAASKVDVDAGTLTLGAADRLADGAAVSVARDATLGLSGNDKVGSLALAGRLAGQGTLTAGSYALAGGTVDADLGTGTLQSRGSSAINGTAGVAGIVLTEGQLAVTRSGALTATPQLDIQAGTLQLAGAQTVGDVSNAGALQTGSTLSARSVDSRGSVLLGGSLTTSGNQAYQGVVQVAAGNAAPALTAGDQAQIVALNAANDFGSGALSLRAGSVQLHDAGALALGDVRLGGGASAIDSAGVLRLQGAMALNDGQLALTSAAPAVASGASLRNNLGNVAYLPNPIDGAKSETALFAAEPVIVQAAGATLDTSAASTLRLRASGGGSIDLTGNANRIAGGFSAVSGGSAGYDLKAAQGVGRVSQVAVRADTLNLVADGTGGAAVRGDVVTLVARQLSTASGAVIQARLPYSVKQGVGSQLPALSFEIVGGASFGNLEAPVSIRVGDVEAATGIGGLYLTALPAPASAQPSALAMYLDCAGCAVAPFYQYAGNPNAVLGFIGGRPLADAPPQASAITSTTSLLEDARRDLFEASVRTENVRRRLRAGVIAEVGKGRPATEGSGGAQRPQTCEAAAGTLACTTQTPSTR